MIRINAATQASWGKKYIDYSPFKSVFSPFLVLLVTQPDDLFPLYKDLCIDHVSMNSMITDIFPTR